MTFLAVLLCLALFAGTFIIAAASPSATLIGVCVVFALAVIALAFCARIFLSDPP